MDDVLDEGPNPSSTVPAVIGVTENATTHTATAGHTATANGHHPRVVDRTSAYARLGRWCFGHPRAVIGSWLAALVAISLFGHGIVGAAFNGEFAIPDSESADGFAVLAEHFPGLSAGGQVGSIVFGADQGVTDPAVVTTMETLFAEVATIEGVTLVSPYEVMGASQINPTQTVAYAQINLDPSIDQTESAEIGTEIVALLPELDGLVVEVGGAALAEFETPEAELIGLAFAVIVLIVAFGSVLAMGLPIAVALFGVGVGAGLIALVSNVTAVPDLAPTLGAMIGLGVGIDYALFIVTRYREATRRGLSPLEATVEAADTAGRAVTFAGITVVISLLGMLLMGMAFVSGLGIGASLTVAATLVASLTLLPALLGLAGERIEVTRYRGLAVAGLVAITLFFVGIGRSEVAVFWAAAAVAVLAVSFAPGVSSVLGREVPPRRERPIRETLPYRWAHLVQDNAVVGLLLGAGVMVVMALPVFGLRLGFSDEGNFAESTTTRRAYDLIATGFGPGANGPLIVVAELAGPADLGALEAVTAALNADPGVAVAAPAFPANLADPAASAAAVIQVFPTTAPQDERTEDTVHRLRNIVIPAALGESGPVVHLTGSVPATIDFTAFLTDRLVVFFGAVLSLSFLLLMMVFRSLLVPLKAVIMNVLSIAAAYGVVVAIFQWGWGAGLLGIEPAPIEPFVPMILFAIVFGLSMDYEVFLLSRIREEYDRTGDPVNSVADGLAATARVISAAAAIMVVVFGSFLFEENRIIKLFGVGLAVAVFLDATLVRMLLVPATMRLLGRRNWWLPGRLDRLLPTLNVEGHAERP